MRCAWAGNSAFDTSYGVEGTWASLGACSPALPPLPPPPLLPPPLLPPPSAPATAGDDPTFVGVDGVAYHILGEPWKYFNVISAPTISLNAQFLPVKPGFIHGKITDTVLGILHLAICDTATGRTLGVTFDVFNGERYCTVRPPGAPEFGGSEQVPCASALASFGVSIIEEGAACLLRSMECGHVLMSKLPTTLRSDLSAVPLNMGRFNVSVGGARLSLVRDLVDRPKPPTPTDCAPLTTWPRAYKACKIAGRVSDGAALQEWQSLPVKERVAIYAYLTAGNASQQMHFHNVRVEALPFAQPDVHGFLGQRAVGPVPPIVTPSQLAALDGYVTSTEQISSNAGTTIRATVAADGTVPQLQGEGAIEGSYRSYQARELPSCTCTRFHRSVYTCRSGSFRHTGRGRSPTRASLARRRRPSRMTDASRSGCRGGETREEGSGGAALLGTDIFGHVAWAFDR